MVNNTPKLFGKPDPNRCRFEGCIRDAKICPELHIPRLEASLSTTPPFSIMLGMLLCCEKHFKMLPPAANLAQSTTVVAQLVRVTGVLRNPFDYNKAFLEPVLLSSAHFKGVKAAADKAKALDPTADSVIVRKTVQ